MIWGMIPVMLYFHLVATKRTRGVYLGHLINCDYIKINQEDSDLSQ